MVDDFLANQPKSDTGLLQTYGPGALAGGNCGAHCDLPDECPAKTAATEVNRWCRHDVYDNALAAIYLTKRGKLDEAAAILGSLIGLMYPENYVAHSFGPNEMPSGRRFSLLAASYTKLHSSAGDYYTPQTTASGSFVDTGNNAWAGLAFSRYAAATGSTCYATVAHDIMHVLRKHKCDDSLGGFMGRMNPTNMWYRSIEHNIDMFAFARALGAREDEESAGRFVSHMYGGRHGGSYRVGTTGNHRCDRNINTGGIPIDGQVWSIAAGADTVRPHVNNAMAFAIRHPGNAPWAHQNGGWASDTDQIGRQSDGAGHGEEFHGFRFSDRGSGVQWEITASGVIAMVQYREVGGSEDVSRHIGEARDSLKRLLYRYGSVPASVRGGNYNAYRTHRPWERFPGGSDTGLGWTYLRYPHVASTVWTGLMLIHQAEDGLPIDDEGNPFEPPEQRVPAPSRSDLSCLAPAPPPPRLEGCARLTAPENAACRSHVEWALHHGRGHPQAGEWYADMRRITGSSHTEASADDWQRAAFCGMMAEECMLPPCRCTHPPCDACGDSVAADVAEEEATFEEEVPPETCAPLSAPTNAACKPHVEWAFQHGRHQARAAEWYEDMRKFTGRTHSDATMEDWQRAAFCGITSDDCGLPPCACSNPPCGGCGDEQ